MRLLLGLVLALCLGLAGCNSAQKKSPKTDPTEDYDYRSALNNFNVGCNYLNEQQPLPAIKYLKEAVTQDPGVFRYHHWLGMAYMMNGQLELAEVELKRAVEINPDSTDSYNNLATIFIETNRFDEADEALRRVLMDNAYPLTQFGYFNLGLCRLRQGRESEAIAAFEQTVKIDPKFYRAYLAIGEIYRENGQYNAALSYFLKAEQGFSNNVNVLFEIGNAYYELGNYEQAQTYLSQVVILFPPQNIDRKAQRMLQEIEQMRN